MKPPAPLELPLAASQAGTRREYDPRLSAAGNRMARELAHLLDQLARMESWLRNRGRAELRRSDCRVLREQFVRLSGDAQSVSRLAQDLGEELNIP